MAQFHCLRNVRRSMRYSGCPRTPCSGIGPSDLDALPPLSKIAIAASSRQDHLGRRVLISLGGHCRSRSMSRGQNCGLDAPRHCGQGARRVDGVRMEGEIQSHGNPNSLNLPKRAKRHRRQVLRLLLPLHHHFASTLVDAPDKEHGLRGRPLGRCRGSWVGNLSAFKRADSGLMPVAHPSLHQGPFPGE
jgi:hypothetical protein